MTASAEAVAAAAAACPGVVRLSSGSAVEIATYLPGQRVHGVRIRDRVVEVHIVAAPDRNLPELAETVRAAVVGVADGRAVDVYVDDLDEPTDDEPTDDDTSTGDEEPAGDEERAGAEPTNASTAAASRADASPADEAPADQVRS